MTTTTPHQLPEDLPTVYEVEGDDKSFIIQPVTGRGLAFTPLAENRGGFPLVVVINDDKKRRHVVRGPDFILGDLVDAKVTVITSEGGGVLGDKWTVTALEDSSAGEAPRPRSDGDGFLQVRGGGERVLFDIDTRMDLATWRTAFDPGKNGTFYVTPSKPTAFTSDYTGQEAFNVGRFSSVALIVEQMHTSGTGLNWSFKPFIDLVSSAAVINPAQPVDSFGAGTVNQFGAYGVPAWNGTHGQIILNTRAEVITDYTTRTPSFLPFVRFRFVVDLNGVDWDADTNSGGWYMRLRALAW